MSTSIFYPFIGSIPIALHKIGKELCSPCAPEELYPIALAQIGRALFSTPIEMSEIAREGPIVTVFGILLGAFLGALQGKEFRWQWVESKCFAFICGALVSICALIVSGCPMRILIRTAYGELNAWLRFRKQDIAATDSFQIALQSYHYNNFESFFGFVPAHAGQQIAASASGVMEEKLSAANMLNAHVEGRIRLLQSI